MFKMKSKRSKSNISSVSETRLSPAVENYLIAMFQLEEQGVRVTSTNLAAQLKRLPAGEGLGTSLPSVGAMIRRMVRENLVKLDVDKQILLTKKGKMSAEEMVRRHRLAERMVVDLLGLELHKAHIEAHRLEHAISKDLEEKINDRLNKPATCPFGHPIPGNMEKNMEETMPLSKVVDGQRLVIDRVPEDDQSLLEYFVSNNFVPGTEVIISEAAAYRGVVKLNCGGQDVVLSYDVADRIWVRNNS